MHHLEKLKPLAQTVLRLSLALVFFYHGFPKLFTQRAQFFALFPKLGFPWYFVYLSGCLEYFGSLLLAVGFFTRLVSLLLTAEMIAVMWKVGLVGGMADVSNYQLELTLAVALFTLTAIGPGPFSLDQLFFRSKK